MDIKLLVVDDSAFMRRIIMDNVKEMSDIEVVGIARNGLDALEKIPRLKPDIITLDIEMPRLNGIETLKRIKKDYDIPVIMLSSIARTDVTIEALELGAEDFIEKPKDLSSNLSNFRDELEVKLKSVSCPSGNCKSRKKKKVKTRESELPDNIEAIVIAASTGGPKVLVDLIKNIPADLKIPIFIVQHMPKGFTTSFAKRLDREARVKVVEASDKMLIEKGVVYLAPGDYHMEIRNKRIVLNQGPKLYGVRPAADYLFNSAAKKYGSNLLSIVLTGMGKDGSGGVKTIKAHGGYNLAQDRDSSLVFGMPGSAIDTGKVDKIMDIEDITNTIGKKVKIWD